MRVTHKYVLSDVENNVSTYEGARFIHVANQREEIAVWAEVNTLERECMTTLHVVGTGGEVPRDTTHVGSALMAGGAYVFHVYAPNPRADHDRLAADDAARAAGGEVEHFCEQDVPPCVHCGESVTNVGGFWTHARIAPDGSVHTGKSRCQSPSVSYGHLAHPADVPCRADGPNPCLGALTSPGQPTRGADHNPREEADKGARAGERGASGE